MSFDNSVSFIKRLHFLSWQDKANLIFVLLGVKPTASFSIDSRIIPENSHVDLKNLNKNVLSVNQKYINYFSKALSSVGFRYDISREVLKVTNKSGFLKSWSFRYEVITFNVGRQVIPGKRHELIGLSFGYPKCCTKAFSKMPVLLKNFPLMLGLLMKAGVDVPRRVYLIYHIPCKYPYCEASFKLAVSFEEILSKHASDVYYSFIKHYDELIETELSQASHYFKKYLNNSKWKFMTYKKFFSSEVIFNKLYYYLLDKGLIK